jgi:hypothetical protein
MSYFVPPSVDVFSLYQFHIYYSSDTHNGGVTYEQALPDRRLVEDPESSTMIVLGFEMGLLGPSLQTRLFSSDATEFSLNE